ncbi:MAG: MFS transporter, partial [Lachnospiraceae bacterium]|nr:MFS transporter [Lachnospiraceae bacterium]
MDNRKKTIRTITALIIVGGVVYAFSGALINTLLNQIIDEYHLTGANEGLMTSLLSVGMMLAIVVCPLIQGRIKKLTMIFVSGIIMTVAMAVSGMAGKAVLFGIASVVLGIGWGLFDTYANSSIIDLYPDDNSGPMGLFHGFYGVGSLLMPVIIQALLFVFIWRANYYLVAAIMLIVMVIFYIVKRK